MCAYPFWLRVQVTLAYLFLLVDFSTPTGVETPDVIDLRKQQRKEPERPLYQVSVSFDFFFRLVFLLRWF